MGAEPGKVDRNNDSCPLQPEHLGRPFVWCSPPQTTSFNPLVIISLSFPSLIYHRSAIHSSLELDSDKYIFIACIHYKGL